jgi:DNA-binding XRE family transcriptional regulator
MTKIKNLHRRWSRNDDYRAAYDGLEEEFRLARALIEARTAAGLSQSQLARRIKTSQSYIACIEGGKADPSRGLPPVAHAPVARQTLAWLATRSSRSRGKADPRVACRT